MDEFFFYSAHGKDVLHISFAKEYVDFTLNGSTVRHTDKRFIELLQALFIEDTTEGSEGERP